MEIPQEGRVISKNFFFLGRPGPVEAANQKAGCKMEFGSSKVVFESRQSELELQEN